MNLNPLNAKTLDDLEQMQRDYETLKQRQNQLEHINYDQNSIPYSKHKLTSTQKKISDEMSKYGSTLTPTLIGCGALGCLGITGYIVDKLWPKQHVPPQIKAPPIYIDLTGDGDASEEFLYENITVKEEPK